MGGVEARPDGHRGRVEEVLRRQAGGVQAAQVHRVPRRSAGDDGGQGAAPRVGGAGEGAAGEGRSKRHVRNDISW